MRVTMEELKQLALDTNGRLQQLAAGVGREPAIILHWSAGHYGQDFADYHIRIDKNGELYADGDLTAVLPHTWQHNTGTIGVVMLCCYNATVKDFGPEPPTDAQIVTMAQVVAVLCDGLELPVDYAHVRTHAEQGDEDGYGPATTCERWDLWMLKPEQARGSGGEMLRGKAAQYKAHMQ